LVPPLSRWRSAITRVDQFKIIEGTRSQLIATAKAALIPLHNVEFVVPFVPTDFSLSAWLFFETDAQLKGSDAHRWTTWLKSELLKILHAHGYPERWLGEVGFAFDSHENVVKNFEGSYFYRLR
jgi:hypothetical protein